MTTPDVFRDAEYIADVSGIALEVADDDLDEEQRSSFFRRQNEIIKKAQSTAKVAFIDHLLRDLDILIYCQLSALYYMDCSIILFALRALVQLVLFTPKAPPFDPTRNHPFIVAIFGSNLICMLVHKFSTPPEAGEARRGYLHGGLFIDFIGQKAPVSVLRLLLLDILIIFLDLVMLGLVVERVKTAGASEVASTADAASSSLNLDTRQDHDSEERGVLRRETPDPARRSRDLEGTEVTGPQTTEAVEGTVDEDRLERTGLLANFLEDDIARGAEVHPRDRFASGEALIMDAGLFDIIREQWRYTPAEAIRRTSYGPSSETTAFLRDRFGIHVGSDGRILRLGGS